MIIEKSEWYTCKICNENISNMVNKYGGSNIYKTDCFIKHIKEHGICLDEYFTERPVCRCGICNKTVSISKRGSNFRYRDYACGRNDGVKKWSKKAKETRRGCGNPMFGKKPWNKGLTKHNSQSLLNNSNKQKNKIVSKQTKEKQSASAKKRLIHGHTGHKHSEKTKNFLRLNTLKMIKNGRYKHTNTKPHKKFSLILDSLKIKYLEEVNIKHWSFDFFLLDYNIYIEVDGDYWHSNPKFYPNGPKTKSQKTNFLRDIAKNKFCSDNKINLIRFWENDILKNGEDIKCKLKKLLGSKSLENLEQ